MIVNAIKLARQQEHLNGEMPLTDLSNVLNNDERIQLERQVDLLRYALEFDNQPVDSANERRAVVVKQNIKCALELICHSSGECYQQPIEVFSQVALLNDPEDAKTLREDLEAFICQPEQLDIAALLAEEVILALPLVPRNPDSKQLNWTSGDEEGFADAQQADNPFAALQVLQNK